MLIAITRKPTIAGKKKNLKKKKKTEIVIEIEKERQEKRKKRKLFNLITSCVRLIIKRKAKNKNNHSSCIKIIAYILCIYSL